MVHLNSNKCFKFSVKETNKTCACILHGQRTVIFLMYNELMTVKKNNNLLVRSDIYLFLHFNNKNMKEASLKVLNIAISV